MGARDIEGIQHTCRIVSHVGQRIGRPRGAGGDTGQVGQAGLVEFPGMADVAVVEADHAKARPRQAVDHAVGPEGKLGRQSHDQQQRHTVIRPRGIDGDTYTIGSYKTHTDTPVVSVAESAGSMMTA